VAPTFTGTAQTWNSNEIQVPTNVGGTSLGSAGQNSYSGTAIATHITTTITPAGTISNLGSGNSHPIMPPAIVLPYILRII
jgi:hypothetical protein